MSTFWLKSGGNLVCFSSFASTLDAMAGNRNSTVERGEKDIMLVEEQEGYSACNWSSTAFIRQGPSLSELTLTHQLLRVRIRVLPKVLPLDQT